MNVVVPLGAAAIAGASAVAGQWNGGRNDKAKWLREERRQAYASCLDLVHRAGMNKERGQNLSTEARTSLAHVRVLGPRNVAGAASVYFSSMLNMRSVILDAVLSDQDDLPTETPLIREVIELYHSAEAEFAEAARRALD